MCNQCGWCCQQEICQTGVQMFDTDVPPCPGLIKNGEIYECAIVVFATDNFPEHLPVLKFDLGIGFGCASIKRFEKINDSKKISF